MKNIKLYIAVLNCIILTLFSCKKDVGFAETEGSLKLSIGVSEKVNVVSRSLVGEEQEILEQNCKIRIYSGETLVQKYQGIENLPAEIALANGTYSVRVTAGDSVAASFEQRFFEGIKEFAIAKGETSTVEVNCGIANTVVAIAWDQSLQQVFKDDCQVTITSATGELVYSSANADVKGYFSLPEDNRKLTCKFSATTLGGEEYVRTTELSDVKDATLYNLTYSYSSVEQGPTGGAALQIQIDETPLIEEEHVITIKQRPVITCKDGEKTAYDLEQPMYLELNAKKDFYVQVATSSQLQSLKIQNEHFQEWGFWNQFDMLSLEGQEEALKQFGISVYEKKQTLTGDVWTILFAKKLVAQMTGAEGSVSTTIEAVDAAGKSRKVVWNIVASNATVVTNEIIPYEVWTSKATLRGTVTTALESVPKIRYRAINTADWTTVEATLVEKAFSKEITGLTPGTTYEYQAMDGEKASSVTCEFTTEATFQPENAGFEYTSTSTSSSAILMYGSGQSMWWDTGNHGSATMNKNVTTPDTSVKHSGNQSILLSSQFVGVGGFIGKFAAGNLFAGKYLKTDGTDGVLGWGRPCTSRPKALKVWVRYEPGTVDNGGSHIADGETDQGIIYVAVGDWAGQESDGETWPFVVKTKNSSSLFSTEKGTYSGDGTIAYGEKVFTESYNDAENLKELTIELDYDNYGGTQRKPTSIIIVASASKYGDYFEGSGTSKMWLDDMELIYE